MRKWLHDKWFGHHYVSIGKHKGIFACACGKHWGLYWPATKRDTWAPYKLDLR